MTYLPSDDSPRWSEAALRGAGRLIRRLHDALVGYVPPEDANGQDRYIRWDREWLLANWSALEQALRPA